MINSSISYLDALRDIENSSIILSNRTNTTGQLSSTYHSGDVNSFIRILFVLLLRAGYILIQLGSIPTENIYIILLHNIVDLTAAIVAYGLVGFMIAYGQDMFDGVTGFGIWIGSKGVDYDNFLIGLSAVIIGSAIITTVSAGRLHFFGYLMTTLMYAGFVEPIIIHWIWHSEGFFHKKLFLKYQVSVKDHAGGLVIHVSAGMGGLVTSIYLGRRLLKLYEIDESSVGTESPAMTILGYFLIILGLIATTLPKGLYYYTHNSIGLILVNNILAIAGSIMVVVTLSFILSRKTFHYWIILRCIQAALAGLVSIAPGVDVYTPPVAFAISCFAGAIFYSVSRLVYYSSIEDYCDVIAINLACGFMGLLTPAMFASSDNLGFSVSVEIQILHLCWQLLAFLAVAVLVFIAFVILCLLLLVTGFLRNKNEKINHQRSINVTKQDDEKCCLQRLFSMYKDTPFLEPGPSGKNPDDTITYRKSYNFERTREPSINAFRNKEKVVQVQGKQMQSMTNNRGSIADETVSSGYDHFKPQHSIYTLTNTQPTIVNFSHIDDFHSAGDFESIENSLEMMEMHTVQKMMDMHTVKKMMEVHKKILKPNSKYRSLPKLNSFDSSTSFKRTSSHHELHRTRKHTNLCRRRNFRRSWSKDSLNCSVQTDYEPSEIDREFDDGIITIMPPRPNTK